MLVVVALCLISVLQVVISLGASKRQPDWLELVIVTAGCLGLAGLYLYFWIVVLELFIKMGPLYYMSTMPPPPAPMYPPPVPVHAVVYESHPGQDHGPQSMFTTGTNQMMYHPQQPASLPIFYNQHQQLRQF